MQLYLLTIYPRTWRLQYCIKWAGPSEDFPKIGLRLLLRLKFTEGARFSTDVPDVSYIAGPTVSVPTPEYSSTGAGWG